MNFMEKRKGVPLPLHESAKTLLNIGIMNDTLFLSIINVVDYSLLVGVNEETKELVVGIIDYFRCYDIIKKIGRNHRFVRSRKWSEVRRHDHW
jgi:singapore isolate B (sub-type 7) whole genome shotgun sequence assembly, scaffold_13